MEEDQRKRRDYVEANRMENQGKIRVDKNTIIQKTNQTSKSNHSPNQDIEDVDFQEVKH